MAEMASWMRRFARLRDVVRGSCRGSVSNDESRKDPARCCGLALPPVRACNSEACAATLRDAGRGNKDKTAIALNKREIEEFFRTRGYPVALAKRIVSTLAEYANRIDHER